MTCLARPGASRQALGLQWVNSDAAAAGRERKRLLRLKSSRFRFRASALPRWCWKKPLVLVETKRDLSSMPLPFEKSADKAAE